MKPKQTRPVKAKALPEWLRKTLEQGAAGQIRPSVALGRTSCRAILAALKHERQDERATIRAAVVKRVCDKREHEGACSHPDCASHAVVLDRLDGRLE